MSTAFSDKLPLEKPQDCMSRVVSGTTSSFIAGGIIGALTANWGDIPQVLQDKPLPALKRTGDQAQLCFAACNIFCCTLPCSSTFHAAGAIMATYGVTFAAIGLAYTGMDCVAETFRGTELRTTMCKHISYCALAQA